MWQVEELMGTSGHREQDSRHSTDQSSPNAPPCCGPQLHPLGHVPAAHKALDAAAALGSKERCCAHQDIFSRKKSLTAQIFLKAGPTEPSARCFCPCSSGSSWGMERDVPSVPSEATEVPGATQMVAPLSHSLPQG